MSTHIKQFFHTPIKLLIYISLHQKQKCIAVLTKNVGLQKHKLQQSKKSP
jgi:hypothetical protein